MHSYSNNRIVHCVYVDAVNIMLNQIPALPYGILNTRFIKSFSVMLVPGYHFRKLVGQACPGKLNRLLYLR